MPTIIAITTGAACGALMRHYLSQLIARVLVLSSGFPLSILLVNALGCFLMGLFIEILALKLSVSESIRVFVTTGFLGSFTTFSAFALEFATLYERGAVIQAVGYMIASTVLSIMALFIGMYLVRIALIS